MKRNKDNKFTPKISFGNFYHEDVEAEILSLKNNLRGIPSLKRKIHGVVKIINYETKIDIQSYMGKIVVTEMTQPNMVALFRKCKGIITNEGGVLSHACIISREYNIPCIVGTSNATKVLIDGDEIIMWPNGHISYESDAPYHP